jgi:hypothetical protein|tara:strand:+ start:26 stop:274 length:249 start_codon:yes stop_codon:yes gene_type:complete
MSYHERIRMMHERMKVRNLDVGWYIDVCNACVNDMEEKLNFWTVDENELTFLVECIFGDVVHDLEIIKKSMRYMERLMEEEE